MYDIWSQARNRAQANSVPKADSSQGDSITAQDDPITAQDDPINAEDNSMIAQDKSIFDGTLNQAKICEILAKQNPSQTTQKLRKDSVISKRDPSPTFPEISKDQALLSAQTIWYAKQYTHC